MAWTVRYDLPTHTAGGNTCYICCAGQRRLDDGTLEPMLDPNRHIEFEGYLIVCSHCIKEGAHQLGQISEREQVRLLDRDKALTAKVEELEIRARMAEEALDALRRYDLVSPKEAHTSGYVDSGDSLSGFTGDAGDEGENLEQGEGAPARRSLGRRR